MNIEKAFKKFMKAKIKYQLECKMFLNTLPDDAQSELHYNGLEGIKYRYPEYYNYLKELKQI